MVVDQVADSLSSFRELGNISHYSTVSRQWLDRTQKHHFESVSFGDQLELGDWRRNVAPDPCGVSRHVRELFWWRIKTLEGFDDHIRALTHVEDIMLVECDILRWPSVVESLAPLGSSLLSLTIDHATTTYNIIIPLLAALPHLRHLRAHSLEVLGDRDGTGLPSRVPFFEDADCLDLLLHENPPESVNWIPPSARFRELHIDVLSILDKSGRVKQWLASSAETLRFLSITEYPGGVYLDIFSSALLSDRMISSRSSFLPTRPLRVHRAGVPTAHDLAPSTWGTRRHRYPLPLLFPASKSRTGSGGVMVRRVRPSGLGGNCRSSPSDGQTVQDYPPRENGRRGDLLDWLGWGIQAHVCAVVSVREGYAQVDGGCQRSGYGQGGFGDDVTGVPGAGALAQLLRRRLQPIFDRSRIKSTRPLSSPLLLFSFVRFYKFVL